MYKFNIILTELCNANCSHCYMSSNNKKNKKTMSFADINKIIDKPTLGIPIKSKI